MDPEKLKEVLDSHVLWFGGLCGTRANLRGADLRAANLRGANLRAANRQGHTLIDAPILFCGGFGSSGRTTMAFCIAKSEGSLWIECGCWSGTIAEFRARIVKAHQGGTIAKEYLLMCDLLEARRARVLEAMEANDGD
jgi:uncharacterized protein YjbI with pentapeptide repeats